jgi:hypothetical protein
MDDFAKDDTDSIPNMDDEEYYSHRNEHYQTVMNFLQSNDRMKQTAIKSLRQGLICGGSAVVGGLMLGPVGGLVGGVLGSIYSYTTTPQYDGIVQQMIHMEDTTKRDELLRSVRLCLLHAGANTNNFKSPRDFQKTLLEFAEQREVRDQIWKACMATI